MDHALLIVWDSSNEVGIPIIDEQHRGMVSLINSFGLAIQHGHQTEFYLNTIFAMIDGYTKLHFTTEEEILRIAGYDDLEQHKELHTTLIKKSFSIAHQSLRLRDPEIYLRFLQEWWMTHIKTCDRQYMPIAQKYLAL